MFKKNWPFIFALLMVGIDLILLNLAFPAAIYLRFPKFEHPLQYLSPWLFMNVLFFPLALGVGVYRGIFKSTLENQKQHVRNFILYMALITMSYLFLIKGHQYSRGVVVIFLFVYYVFLELSHTFMYRFNRFLISRGFGNKRILIVGTDSSARAFFENLSYTYGDYYKVEGFIANGQPHKVDHVLEPYVVGKYDDIEKLIPKLHINEVFIVSDSMMRRKYEPIRLACEDNKIKVKMVSPAIRNLMRQIKVKDITGVPLTTEHKTKKTKNAIVKRIFDLIVLSLSSLILLPVGLILAAIIKITSRGPVFFKQQRSLYKGGPSFTLYKFRTMRHGADDLKDEIWENNESDHALFKMKKDPRVTAIGRFLRKYSLDEMPQFINVLKGDMSLVGPRPLPVDDFDKIRNGAVNYDWYNNRGEAKPGITGLWQISGRSKLSFEEMCMLDLYYIENQSIFFDLEIMFETIPVMFFGRGAY